MTTTENLSPVPGHINTTDGHFCTREGQMAPNGRCPDGCDHADHYSNDGHPECEDTSFYDTLRDSISSDVPGTVWESDALSKGAGE